MGRPIYSQAYISAPAVRTEPPPTIPPYEKWSYWNAFDPDSDEFFENEIIEDFIDQLPANEDDRLIVHMAEASDSSGSSEGGGSDRGSPMAVGSDDPARMLAEVYPEYWAGQTISPLDVPSNSIPSQYPQTFYPTPESDARVPPTGTRPRSATVTVLPRLRLSATHQNPTDSLPRTSRIVPLALTTRSVPPIFPSVSPIFPSTPPSQSALPPNQRILAYLAGTPPSTPPHPGGPLTNPDARMSLAHITPTLVRVRDVVI